MALKELQDRRTELGGKIHSEAERFNTAPDKWTAEDEAAWVKLNADYDTNKTEFDAEKKRVEDATAASKQKIDRANFVKGELDAEPPFGRDGGNLNKGPVNKSRFSPEDLSDGMNRYKSDHLTNALHGWLMMGSDKVVNVNDRHRNAAKSIGQSLDSRIFTFDLDLDWTNAKHSAYRFKNSLSGEDGTAGGYTKDQTLIHSLEMAMLSYSGVMQVAEIIRTATGEPMRWPTVDDTSNTGRQVGENASHDAGTDPTFGAVNWNAYTFTSDIVKVPNELMTDSVFNLATILGQLLGIRLGRIQNTKYTTGNGSGTAKGIVTCANAGVTTASSTAIAFDELIDLEHSLDPTRRSMPGVGYMFNDAILKALRKLKDGEGRYLWQAGANTGAPDSLNTYPYAINQAMASSIATTAVTVLFGELPAYKVRQVGQVVLRRLDERFADTNQTGFLAIMRGDGNLLDAGDHPIKKLTQV